MPSINLPSDFAEDVVRTLRDDPRAPAVVEFRHMLRAEVLWSPRMPRTLLWVARRLHASLYGPNFVLVTLTGFRGRRLQHVGAALWAIARAWRRRGTFIYEGDKDLLVFEAGPQRHRDTPAGALRTTHYPSPAAASSPPPTPSPSPSPSPAPAPSTPPPRPTTPTFVTR
jgi:hypothetical protein